MSPTIFISAGEASGEHYGALLIAALKLRLAANNQSATFFGMGGERMVAEGLDRIVRSEDMAVMGITEVIRHLPASTANSASSKPPSAPAAPMSPSSSTFPTSISSSPSSSTAAASPSSSSSAPALGLEKTPHQAR